MSEDAERELDAFLDELPSYQRKVLDKPNALLTPDEARLFADWMNTTESEAIRNEHMRLLQRVPARMREYRHHHRQVYGTLMTSVLLPESPQGRPPKATLAEYAMNLKAKGSSYAQIALRWNQTHNLKPEDKDYATGESIRKLIKRRVVSKLRPPGHK